MKNIKKFYNSTSFNYFRRKLKPIDINNAFIQLLESKEKLINSQKTIPIEKESIDIHTTTNKTSNIENITLSNNKDEIYYNTGINRKNSCLELLYPKSSLEEINKIRDLFIEFDTDKSHMLDQKEIFLMFNINKIPIKYEEVKELFGFSKRKKYIKFYEFINLTINPKFYERFKKFISNNVKCRVKEGDICPNDYKDMLTHLCEFGQLSPELKKQTRNGINYKKNTSPSFPKYLLELKNKRNSTFHKNKTIDISKKKNLKRNSFSDKINENIDQLDKINDKENSNKIYANKDFKKDNNIINNTINNKESPNLFEIDREYSNFINLSRKKLQRYHNNLEDKNIKDKIMQRKEKLSQSLEIINNNTNSDIGDKYICYYPTENVFKKMKEKKIIDFQSKRKESIPNIKKNRNSIKLYYENNFKNRFQFFKNRNHLKSTDFINILHRNRKKKFKEKDFIALLSKLNLNDPHFPVIKPKQKYPGNTFITTTIINSNTYSNTYY